MFQFEHEKTVLGSGDINQESVNLAIHSLQVIFVWLIHHLDILTFSIFFMVFQQDACLNMRYGGYL